MALIKIGSNGLDTGVGGKVLQVVQSTLNTTVATTATSFVGSGLQVNITPSSTSSKILVYCFGSAEHTSADQRGDFTIYRDSTNLAVSGANADALSTGNDRNNGEIYTVAMSFLDTPSTVSQITYSQRFKSLNGSTIYFPRIGVAVIQAIEIAG